MGFNMGIRPYRQSDRNDVINLLNHDYPGQEKNRLAHLRKKRWSWFYHENPFKINKDTLWVAEDNKKNIVGCMGSVPVMLKIKDKEYEARFGVDLMVNQELRKKGIGILLLKKWIDSSLISLNLGVGGEAHNIEKRMGFIDILLPKRYIKVLSSKNLIYKQIKNKSLACLLSFFADPFFRIFFNKRCSKYNAELKIKEIKKPCNDFDSLWKRAKRYYSIIITRNRKFIEWRFFKSEFMNYKVFGLLENSDILFGYIVLRIEKRDGMTIGKIIDLIVDFGKGKPICALLDFAVSYFKKCRCDVIFCPGTNHRYIKELKKTGFFKNGSFTFTVKINGDFKIDRSFILNGNNWYISAADSDYDFI